MSKTKVNLSASDISTKWNTRMKQSVSDIQKGIDSITENPAEKAIAAKDKMLQGITAAVNDGRWEAGLRKVSLADWKTKTKQKVGERLAGGVDGAMTKRREFDQWLVGTLNNVLPEIAAMPKMTIQDSINRASAMITAMHENRYKKS